MTIRVTPIHTDMFYAEGRGPELQRVHWSGRGTGLHAIDYFNPDDVYETASMKHVRFERSQVVLITPEEVIDYRNLASSSAENRNAGIFNLGQSDWLKSFDQRHLEKCAHFQLLFYDQLFDVVCEAVTCHRGPFASTAG